VQVSGEPVGDLPVEADLNERRPSESVVTVRPWLLADPPSGADDVTAAADAAQSDTGAGETDRSGPAGSSPDR
jgi:hypothetical protein